MKFDERINRELSDVQLPGIFVLNSLSGIDAIALKIYIYIKFLAKNHLEYSISDISKKFALKQIELQSKLDYLENEELILKTETGYVILDVKEQEINKTYQPKMKAKLTEQESTQVKSRMSVASAINETYFQGLMTKSWYDDINNIFSKYCFEEDVVMALFNECNDKGALKRNYIFKVAETWFLGGVKTFPQLEDYLLKQTNVQKIASQIKTKLRFSRPFTEYEEAMIKTWLEQYKYTFKEIDYAIMKTTAKGTPTIGYINGILKKWNEEGLKTIQDIKAKEELKQKEKNASTVAVSSKLVHKNYEQRKDVDLNQYYDNM